VALLLSVLASFVLVVLLLAAVALIFVVLLTPILLFWTGLRSSLRFVLRLGRAPRPAPSAGPLPRLGTALAQGGDGRGGTG
jgi:hypothetical protein